MRADLEVLESAVGHRFRDGERLRRALTHRSHVHEKAASGETELADNEQFEFLGDAILGFLVSESLVRHCPGLPEGRLSKLKAYLVSASHLHRVAQKLDLGRYLLLGRGEEMSGGRDKKTLLADGLEALLAAIYLDGGMEPARVFVTRHVLENLEGVPGDIGLPLNDFKSALQELAQARGLPQPEYAIVKERGPGHAKAFTVEVRIGKNWAGRAESFSKKSAGQQAAQVLLEKLIEADTEGPGSAGRSLE